MPATASRPDRSNSSSKSTSPRGADYLRCGSILQFRPEAAVRGGDTCWHPGPMKDRRIRKASSAVPKRHLQATPNKAR